MHAIETFLIMKMKYMYVARNYGLLVTFWSITPETSFKKTSCNSMHPYTLCHNTYMLSQNCVQRFRRRWADKVTRSLLYSIYGLNSWFKRAENHRKIIELVFSGNSHQNTCRPTVNILSASV